MSATYEGRDTLSLSVYFTLMKRELRSIAKLMVNFGKSLIDLQKIYENLCNYLMENIVNCDYEYAAIDDIRILSLTNSKHQFTIMFGRAVYLCQDYYMENETPYDPPPSRIPYSPLNYTLPLPPGHRRIEFGEEIVVTNPNLTTSPHGIMYEPMQPRSRSHAKSLRKQREATNVKTSPPSQLK
jgi:hypothetical protein